MIGGEFFYYNHSTCKAIRRTEDECKERCLCFCYEQKIAVAHFVSNHQYQLFHSSTERLDSWYSAAPAGCIFLLNDRQKQTRFSWFKNRWSERCKA